MSTDQIIEIREHLLAANACLQPAWEECKRYLCEDIVRNDEVQSLIDQFPGCDPSLELSLEFNALLVDMLGGMLVIKGVIEAPTVS
jgi:hypothetical protein